MKEEIWLPHWEHLSDDRCDKTNMVAKYKIFVTQ